jgi:hypothetical protein
MPLLNWIASNPDTAATIAMTVGLWLWNKARGKKQDDIWDTIMQLGRHALPDLLKSARLYDDAYVLDQIQKAIWAGLGRLGVKRTPIIDKFVSEAAEHVKAELAQRLFDAHITDFVKVQTTTKEILESAPAVTTP